jgi:hypothetical protein
MGGESSAAKLKELDSRVSDENRKTVIAGALRRWDQGEGPAEASQRAQFVRKVLERILHEDWSIVVYDKVTEWAGDSTSYNYEGKWWVYGVPTIRTSFNKEKIVALLDTRFGWACVKDIGKLQTAAENAITQEFSGRWKVFAAKFPPQSGRCISYWGAY